ncbi:MAG: hypothetical protein R3F02_18275 [Thiolinea sp.]
MSFLSPLFFTYLLVMPLAVIAFGLWLWRYMNRMAYAPEKSILFTVIAMICLTFITFTLGTKLNRARISAHTPSEITPENPPEQTTKQATDRTLPTTPVQTQEKVVPPENSHSDQAEYPSGENQPIVANMTEEDRLRLFETQNFPGLYEQRLALGREIKDLEDFFRSINELVKHTPKQRPLLKDIALIRKNGYDQLVQRNISVSQHLRDFWVHYNTGNSHDAIKKFNPIADQLTKKIKETRGQLLENKRREAQVISNYMSKAGGSLKNHAIPATQAGRITAYTRQNRQLITDWLSSKGSVNIPDVLNNLVQQRTLINNRIKQIQSFRQRYPDLNSQLSRTEKLWVQAKESNYYAEYRLLFAAETRYVVEYMNLAGNTADKRLDAELNTYADAIASHAEQALEKAEQAYKPASVQ